MVCVLLVPRQAAGGGARVAGAGRRVAMAAAAGYCKTQQGCNLATRGDVISSHFPTDTALFNAAFWLASCDKQTTIFVFGFELIEPYAAIHSNKKTH